MVMIGVASVPEWVADTYARPCDGEHVCGDVAVVISLERGLLLAVVDGLGHGPAAAAVSEVAVEWLRSRAHADVAGVVDGLSEKLRRTEGAAVGICYLDHASGRVTYAGIGNTVLRTFGSADEGRLVSRDGVAGRTSIKAKAFSAQLRPGDLLLLYSDGVRAHFQLDDIPAIRTQEPAAIARTVVLRFGKVHDDAACIAARWQTAVRDECAPVSHG
jgi:serine/threonine protein phosphatase PrpC